MKKMFMILTLSLVAVTAQAKEDPYAGIFDVPNQYENLQLNPNSGNGNQGEGNHGNGNGNQGVPAVPLSNTSMMFSLGLFMMLFGLYVHKKQMTKVYPNVLFKDTY